MEGIKIISKEQLIEDREELSCILKKLEDSLRNIPDGELHLGKSNGVVQYFYCKDGKTIYLPKKEIELVKRLAQKPYDKRVLKHVKKRLSQINRILSDYENNEIENFYLSEHPERRKLINPVEPTFQQKLELWLSEPYESKPFRSDTPVIKTNSGMRVRSKTEKIMADYFDLKGVKYKYECPLELKPYGVIYPDFTFISPRTGRELYWEHEGMMDNPDYARTAVMKIELYEKNGICPGENLILTFETANSVIDMELVKQFTKKYLV
ncbi:hypothetical protein SAMN02910289_01058 [Lachnospiraceae bacterium RM5]|nr:hypothetical protein SAMN02910289_01058 [Lachnospiraceae bacterium RM5]